MHDTTEYQGVLASYPAECRPHKVEYLGTAGGFSGARFWRFTTPCGTLCLRRWPTEHPTVERLEFIQAVLWQVQQQGFGLVPLPIPAANRKGYVQHRGALWELTPWMPGKADFHQNPSPRRLAAALEALAGFHEAAAGFPLPVADVDVSPGIQQRVRQLAALAESELELINRSVSTSIWPEMVSRAQRLLALFPLAAGRVGTLLNEALQLKVPLSPCIRDIWHDHVLFTENQVSGLIDFGAMQAETVAADIARLLGSLVGDDPLGWEAGLAAYTNVRALTPHERTLITAFDQSTVLMSGLSWLRWVYVERRWFEYRDQILLRLDDIAARLEVLAERKLV